MIVHFICRGNAYRSRLAEAYLNSKKIPDIQATSSGIEANFYRFENGPVSWYAMRLLYYNKLVQYMSFLSKQTTQKLLAESDLVIFMNKGYCEYCQKKLNFSSQQFEVWNIPDVGDFQLKGSFGSKERTMEVIDITEKTFGEIKSKVDKLVKRISK